MLCVIDHKSPCEQGCPYRYREGGCFWEDARRASKSYYRICPKCGAHLDPGEVCDCMKKPLQVLPTPETATKIDYTYKISEKEVVVNGS